MGFFNYIGFGDRCLMDTIPLVFSFTQFLNNNNNNNKKKKKKKKTKKKKKNNKY